MVSGAKILESHSNSAHMGKIVFCKSVTFANITSLLSGPCKEKRIMNQLSVKL